MKKYFILIFFVAFFSCEFPLGGICDTSYQPGVEVSVMNANGDFINDKITAVVFEDNFRDTLTEYQSNAAGQLTSLAGAYERSGNYSLIITSDLYETYTETGIHVFPGGCHVKMVNLAITLNDK